LQDSYDLCAQALNAYWPKLQNAQGMADRALEQARTAQGDLSAAQAALTDAQDWVSRAGDEAERLQDEEDSPEAPSESEVRSAVRDHQAAQQAATSAQSRVDDAQERLDAARELARQARDLREEAARTCAQGIDEASDAGIQNRRWWEDAIDWVRDNWDTIVEICKVIVAVVGIVAMIIGGPLALLVLAAALVVLADTLIKYSQGRASLWDVAFAALDCIPGMKGLTTLGGLARGIRSLATTGLRGLRQGVLGLGRTLRRNGRPADSLVCRTDPVDMATGEVVLNATDVELPGVLPLVLRRHHRSSLREGTWFGRSWASTLDQRLVLDDAGLRFVTDDGMILDYPRPLAGEPVLPVEGPRWGLSWDGAGGGRMTVHQQETGHTLHFAPVPGRRGCELPLVAITDRNGNRIDIHYDTHGAPREVVHAGGYRVGVTTDGGRITALRLLSAPGEPVLVRYGYDGHGNLAEIRDSSGQPLTLRYDDHRRVTGWEDRNGFTYRYIYDADGRCVATDGTEGALASRIVHDTEANRTLFTDPLGHTTVYQFNDSYQLVTETDPQGHHTHREWDRHDRLLSLTDALGHTTRYRYDAAGNRTAVVHPDGTTVRTAFNDLGLPTDIHQPDGTTWHLDYDAHGNRVTLTDPAGYHTRYAYHPHGGLASVTDPAGRTTHVTCDAAGLPVGLTDPVGAVTCCRRDAFGRPVEVTDAAGATTAFAWTVEGRPLRRTDPLGGTRRWEWDADGNLVAYTDENGGVTRYTYGPFGVPLTQTGPDGARYAFTRDARLALTAVTDPAGRSWTYTYDPVGRLLTECDYDGRTTRYTLDAVGRPATRTNAAGETVTYRYDALGRLVAKTLPDGRETTYTRDPLGRVVQAETPGVTLARAYDPLGNLLSETVNGRTLSLGYDATGRLTSRTTPSGHTSVWSYSEAGTPASLTTGGRVLTFEHDPVGREVSRQVGEHLALGREWDAGGRLTRLAATTGGRPAGGRAYRYRADGYPTAETTVPAGAAGAAAGETAALTTEFTLDPVGRITATTAVGDSEEYAYDATGNQTTATWSTPADTGATGPRTYDGTLLTRAGAIRYAYDAAGRVVFRQRTRLSRKPETWRYVWDAEDRLTEVVTPDGTRWCYLYDPFGRRVAKLRLGDAPESVAARTDFTWHYHALVEETTDDRTLTWDYAGLQPLAQTESGTADEDEVDRRFYAIVTDLVGAPLELVAEDGTTAWRARRTVWGVTTAAPGSRTGTPLRFPGQYADEETGWHYNHNRHYDPATGRYTSPDPLGLLPAPNAHTYPRNPHVWVDPLGLTACDDLDNLINNLDDDVYFHYTSEDGFNRIMSENGARFVANDRGKLFFTQEMLSPGEVESFIFIGNPLYRGKGDFAIAFRRPEGAVFRPGEQPNEVIHQGGLKISMDNILFAGRNPF
jgi:RHS repeat-associated protein